MSDLVIIIGIMVISFMLIILSYVLSKYIGLKEEMKFYVSFYLRSSYRGSELDLNKLEKLEELRRIKEHEMISKKSLIKECESIATQVRRN